jgi:hypothetical protein
MTLTEIQSRIKLLRAELEHRHNYGTVKMASADGKPIPTIDLQNELYSLIYKLSRMD